MPKSKKTTFLIPKAIKNLFDLGRALHTDMVANDIVSVQPLLPVKGESDMNELQLDNATNIEVLKVVPHKATGPEMHGMARITFSYWLRHSRHEYPFNVDLLSADNVLEVAKRIVSEFQFQLGNMGGYLEAPMVHYVTGLVSAAIRKHHHAAVSSDPVPRLLDEAADMAELLF